MSIIIDKDNDTKSSYQIFLSRIRSPILIVVYFDQQMGAMHTFC